MPNTWAVIRLHAGFMKNNIHAAPGCVRPTCLFGGSHTPVRLITASRSAIPCFDTDTDTDFDG